MPVTTTNVASELILVMDNGIGTSGRSLTKSRIYKNIRSNASDEDLYAVAQGIASLQDKLLLAVQRRNTVEIEEA